VNQYIEVEKGLKAVPGSWAYSRFLKHLMKHEEEIEEVFNKLVETLKERVPEFGKYLVVDGKGQLPEGARHPCQWEEEMCENPNWEERREMVYGGFEKDRRTLKYRCPAKHYGYECGGEKWCPVGKAVRIPLGEDRRVFTPWPDRAIGGRVSTRSVQR
jgi:hypothetical protein